MVTRKRLSSCRAGSMTGGTLNKPTVLLMYLHEALEALLRARQTVLRLRHHLSGSELDSGLPLH